MSRFAEVLARASERLSVPQPARSRILLEIAADMEDLYAANLNRGLDEAEARRRAIDSCDLSPEALDELKAIHSGPVGRMMARLFGDDRARRRYALLSPLAIVTVALGHFLVRDGRIVRDAGGFVWPVFLLGLSALVLALIKVYQLYLRRDHRPRRLRRGLGALLRFVIGLPVLGFLGSWLEVLHLVLAADPVAGAAGPLMMAWALRSTALLQISLGLAVLGAVAWFLLSAKVTSIEKEEAALLLEL